MSYILLTGSTGLLGRHLLRDLLVAGEQVVVIVRPCRGEDVASRIEAALQPFERSLGRALPRPVIFSGALELPNLGLDANQISWLNSNCDRILHSAASLAFEKSEYEPHRSNVDGTKNMLSLCKQANIRRLYHISTAFICGLREGRILETEFQEGQQFANIYEETKAEAERLIREAEAIDAYTIFRPSIIVGDSRTGYTSTFHGFYAPLRVLQAIWRMTPAEQLLDVDYLGVLGLSGVERKNIVPVDWVSEAIVKISQREQQANHVYQLTSSHPVSVLDILATFQSVLTSYFKKKLAEDPMAAVGQQQSKSESLDIDSFAEKFADFFSIYKSHWRDDPDFDNTIARSMLPDLPSPVIDNATLLRLCEFALDANFGYPPPKPAPTSFHFGDWLSDRLSNLQDAPSSRRPRNPLFSLICTGPGGGSCTIDGGANGVQSCDRWNALPGTIPNVPWLRTTSSVMESLVAGRTRLDDAIQLGMVATTFEATQQRQLNDFISMSIAPKSDIAAMADRA